jgi:hypothetical protein
MLVKVAGSILALHLMLRDLLTATCLLLAAPAAACDCQQISLGLATTVRTLVTPCLDPAFGATHLLLILCMLTGRNDFAALMSRDLLVPRYWRYTEASRLRRQNLGLDVRTNNNRCTQ